MAHLLSTKKWTVLVGFMLCTLSSFAQDTAMTAPMQNPKLFSGTQSFRTWSFGITGGGLGPAILIGGRNDFANWEARLGYGAYIKKQLSHGFALQVDFLRGIVAGNNGSSTANPYSSFKTEINWSAAFSGVVTLGNIDWSQLHTAVQPYISIGGGLINYNPHLTTLAGANIDYKPNGSISELFIPVGLGLKFNLSNVTNLEIGYSMNFVDGDNFDGYFKPPYAGDKFSYGHVGLEFALGNTSKPQLARHNAPAALAKDLWDKNTALRNALTADEQRINDLSKSIAEANKLKDELAKMKMDTDQDGVADYFDKCPGTPAGTKVDGAGCPLPVPPAPKQDTTIIKQEKYYITEEDKRIVNEAIRNLEFDFGKSTIREKSYASLKRVAEILIKKGFSLKLAGHTDNVGSDAANLKLSKDRAESVKSYLASQGANPSRIEAVGYGKSQPIATNKTAEGRQKNRRVEFTLY